MHYKMVFKELKIIVIYNVIIKKNIKVPA